MNNVYCLAKPKTQPYRYQNRTGKGDIAYTHDGTASNYKEEQSSVICRKVDTPGDNHMNQTELWNRTMLNIIYFLVFKKIQFFSLFCYHSI